MLRNSDPGETRPVDASFSQVTGMIYIFNIIVGTGALALPKAFLEGGYILSTLLLIILAIFSYITATYMIESMAIANFIKRKPFDRMNRVKDDSDVDETSEEETNRMDTDRTLLLPDASNRDDPSTTTNLTNDANEFEIVTKVEMSEMANMFLNKTGLLIFYVCISLYLFGDLAIYGSAVPKTIRDLACTYQPPNCSATTINSPCWSNSSLTRHNAYQIFVTIFFSTLGLFVFSNAQKTKLLQIVTTVLRWSAFLSMIILCIIHISKTRAGDTGKNLPKPNVFKFSNLPPLFGICVYSFMCHHSIPSIIAPIRMKSKLKQLFAYDYICIALFYLLLSYTAIFTFDQIEDLYTLNFRPTTECKKSDVEVPQVLAYFISLFPVFTLSSSFPIIGITLRNNLETMLKSCFRIKRKQRFFLVLFVLILPATISVLTENINFLVGFTGSYAGVAVQYVIPALLVYNARRQAQLKLRRPLNFSTQSYFQNKFWIFGVLLWAWIAIIVITVYHIVDG